MKRSLVLLALSIPLFACGSKHASSGSGAGGPTYTPFPLPANTYSHGDPSGKEQAELEQIQAARAAPGDYIKTVIDLPSIQPDLQAFGVSKQKVLSDFAGYSP